MLTCPRHILVQATYQLENQASTMIFVCHDVDWQLLMTN